MFNNQCHFPQSYQSRGYEFIRVCVRCVCGFFYRFSLFYNKYNNNSLAHLVDSPNLMVNWTKKLAENDLPNGLEKYEVMHHLLI